MLMLMLMMEHQHPCWKKGGVTLPRQTLIGASTNLCTYPVLSDRRL